MPVLGPPSPVLPFMAPRGEFPTNAPSLGCLCALTAAKDAFEPPPIDWGVRYLRAAGGQGRRTAAMNNAQGCPRGQGAEMKAVSINFLFCRE